MPPFFKKIWATWLRSGKAMEAVMRMVPLLPFTQQRTKKQQITTPLRKKIITAGKMVRLVIKKAIAWLFSRAIA